MIKVINEIDIRKASDVERCRILIAIIKRRSGIYTRYKNSLVGKKYDEISGCNVAVYKKV